MKIGRREIMMGILFALFIAIFINYNSIERLLDPSREFSVEMLYPLLFSIAWFLIISMVYYLLYTSIFDLFYGNKNRALMVTSILMLTIGVSYILVEIYPVIRDIVIPEEHIIHRPAPTHINRMIGVQRGLNSRQFMHLLVAILNLFFVSILRLLYRNQEIERHNEQLQLESVKSRHSALVGQINPHFFFNSLGSLRYIILKGESDSAIEFLDNLTSIFRKTLKLESRTLHTLTEEVELTRSYMHIIRKRFAGKIFINFQLNESLLEHMLSPLSLLTLMENIIKHNTISTKCPIRVLITTTDDKRVLVENNIVPKFEEVESNGIGLINLNKQYELLTGEGIDIIAEDDIFSVSLPLIDTTTL